MKFYVTLLILFIATIGWAVDNDNDTVDDSTDNCQTVANPTQADTDSDAYGNACDGDFNASNIVDATDFNLFLPDFTSGTDSGIGSDHNDSGVVDATDYTQHFLPQFARGAPGPSAAYPTLYNIPNKNIHDTYDPLCDGTDTSITWCDGFEDGTWVVHHQEPLKSDPNAHWGINGMDGWTMPPAWNIAQDSGDRTRMPTQVGVTPGPQYAQCNSEGFESGVDNDMVADFGAFGTPCGASTEWLDTTNMGPSGSYPESARQGVATLMIDQSAADNPQTSGNLWQKPTHPTGTDHFSLRWVFKQSGASSQRCPGGPPCPGFVHKANAIGQGNGYKMIGLQGGIRTWGGIVGPNFGTANIPNSTGVKELLLGGLATCGGTTPNSTQYGDDSPPNWIDDSPAPNTQLVHHALYDHYIAVEVEGKMAAAPDGIFRLWADDCGKDGRQCTGTPTLRIEKTGADYPMQAAGNCALFNGVANGIVTAWFEHWTNHQEGEIQFDEIVFRDRTLRDEPIGWMQPVTLY